MVVNVEIISREMIKPSSPTPHQLRHLKLSLLDQIAPPIYIPIILFYQTEFGHDIDHRVQKLQFLKNSLSDVLTRFYPLAGRIENNISIDCNDTGVEFVEAQVHAHLSQVIEKPEMEVLKQFLPIEPYGSGGMGLDMLLLAIQVNFFDCGGMAIGTCMSHKIADASSLVTFINAWAATCRGASEIMPYPNFDLATRFPPRELSGFPPTAGMTKENIVRRWYLFDKMKLEALKKACGSRVKNPTRVEVVSAFIWKQFMEVAKHKKEGTRKFSGAHAVNLRPKMGPPLLDYAFGNLWRFATCTTRGNSNTTFQDLVEKWRYSIREIDNEYVKKLENGDEYLDYLKRIKEQVSKSEIETCSFSSWCKFPVYEADHGWGKPVWVCMMTVPIKNVVILTSTKCGDGIEAWVNMLEEDRAMIEGNLLDSLSLVV